jgi:hypothetical protein
VAAVLWLFVAHLRTSSLWLLAPAGALLGYSALTRPVGVFFVPALALVLQRSRDATWRRTAARGFVLAACAGAVLTPWVIRNYNVHKRMVLIATNGGSTFYGSNNDIVLHDREYLGSWISTVGLPGRQTIEAAPDEVSHDEVEWRLGKTWVRSHLADMPLLSCYKVARFWLPEISSHNSKAVIVFTAGYLPFGVLMLLGLGVSLRTPGGRTPPWLALHAILAANLVSSLIFYGSPRFRDSITPVLMVYTAAGIELLIRRRTKTDAGAGETATAVRADHS